MGILGTTFLRCEVQKSSEIHGEAHRSQPCGFLYRLRRIPLLPPTTSSWPSSLESKRVAFLSPSPCVLVPRRIPNVKGKGLCGTWFTNVFRKGCFQPTDDLRFFCCTSRGSTDAGRGLDKDDMFHIVFVRQNLCFCWCLPRMGLRSMYRIRMISHAYHI